MNSLASVIARSLREKLKIDHSILERFSDLIIPKRITGKTVERYIRRAIRNGSWRSLEAEKRALLMVTRRWGVIRSRILVQIIRKIFTEIEIHTLKGRAVLYGIIIALKSTIYPKEVLSNISKLLTIGISYLNSPPTYRYYG